MRTVFSERYAGRLLGTLTKAEFEEESHPRGPGGRFAPKGAATSVTREDVERVFSGRTKPPTNMAEVDKVMPRYKQGELVAKRLGGTPPPDAKMAAVSAKAEATTSAFGKRIVEESERTGVEYVFAVENGGGGVVGMTEGDESSAKATEIFLEMSGTKGYTLVHNHPNEASFSMPDLVLFATIPQFTRAVVVSKDRKYTIEKPEAWNVNQSGGTGLLARVYEDTKYKLMPKYDPGPLPDGSRDSAKDNAAWVEQSHELVQETAKSMGLTYKRETRA